MNNTRLLIDALRSTLRVHGLLKRKPVSFWNYVTSDGIIFRMRKDICDSNVILENCWLKIYFQKIKNLPQKGVIIDVGAHIGSFSLPTAYQNKDLKIFSFEPNPDNFKLFMHNIQANHMENRIFPFNMAVGKKTGEKLRLYMYPDNSGMSSSVLLSSKEDLPYHDTECISLEDIFKENKISKCDVLKLDCEGGEYEILLSTPEKVFKRISQIILEYHHPGDIKAVKNRLEKFGFKVTIYNAFSNKIVDSLAHIPLLYAKK